MLHAHAGDTAPKGVQIHCTSGGENLFFWNIHPLQGSGDMLLQCNKLPLAGSVLPEFEEHNQRNECNYE
jgi:hypothetical protein